MRRPARPARCDPEAADDRTCKQFGRRLPADRAAGAAMNWPTWIDVFILLGFWTDIFLWFVYVRDHPK